MEYTNRANRLLSHTSPWPQYDMKRLVANVQVQP
jgi:hypothetical protein